MTTRWPASRCHWHSVTARRDFLSSDQYYALKVRPVYRSYPVYAPGREPAGYLDSLKQKAPEIIFDASQLRTEQDWIRAGEAVFHSQTVWNPVPPGDPRPQLVASLPGNVAPDGVIPSANYVVRRPGVVEYGGGTSCASCHTRVMPDGSLVKGAQGNLPTQQLLARLIPPAVLRDFDWRLSGAPWTMSRADFEQVGVDELTRRYRAMQAGVFERHGTSSLHPVHIPSLIGLKDIAYLDATGLMQHRSIGDLMRYAIANYGLDIMAHFGDFQPSPTQAGFAEDGTRFSDEQLYALARYIYSLTPPPNPNPFDDRARRGQQVFQQQGCAGCHTPPAYTNNRLTPAIGFQVPDDVRATNDIMPQSVGTDPGLALRTRRGTGFYKVPSLRGVWFRNAFSHSGQAETLEEWFDASRLQEGYVPRGFHLAPGPIRGHEFGLKLSAEDRGALIAFLKTL